MSLTHYSADVTELKFTENHYLCITIATSRTYHPVHLDISSCQSDRICYVILPERLKEKDGKNKRLASVEEATLEAVDLLKSVGKEVSFEYNKGNHFGPLIDRIKKAINGIYTAAE